MWMEKRNGKYRYHERYIDPFSEKQKTVSVTLEKKNDNLAFNLLQEKINSATNVQNAQECTFEVLVDKYIDYSYKSLKQSTARRNEFFCKSFLKIYDKDILCNNITARYIKVLLDATDKTNASKNEFLTRLKALMRWGYQNDYIDDIRWIDKLVPYKDDSARAKIKDKYLEEDELDKLLKSMQEHEKGYHWYLFTKFLVLSGMRVGEAIALDKADVKKDIIIINKTYDTNNDIINTTKTVDSTREISIQNELAEVIKEIKIYYRLSDIQSIHFFSSSDGSYANYPAYRKFLKEHSIKALGRKITPHTLRHTHTSIMAANGLDLDTISRRLGHSNSGITRDIYFHVTKKLKEEDAKKIKNIKIL